MDKVARHKSNTKVFIKHVYGFKSELKRMSTVVSVVNGDNK